MAAAKVDQVESFEKIEGNRLDVQSPRLRSWLTGMEDKSNGKEVEEASKWINHGGQFQDNNLHCQMRVQPRLGSQCRP